MSKTYSPRIVTDSLVMCLDPSQNKSYGTTDLPVKGDLLLWLDASDDSTFSYSSGTEVSQWRDKSGNNFHANQSTVGQQPSRSTTVNSRKSVNFTSTNADFMRVNSGMVFTNSVTAIVFIKPGTQNNAYANILDQDHGMDSYNGWVIQRNNTASQWLVWLANGANTTWLNTNAVSYTDNTPQIVTLTKGSSTLSLSSNGTSSGDIAVADQQIRQANYVGLNIGYWRAGAGRFYNGEMCEILVYNRALSSTEIKQVHTYLGQKWGISNTDRSIIDLSGFDDNGLFGNGSTSNMPLYDFYNKSFKFYASNKYIKLGNNTNINQFAGDFTVSLWAMATAENSNYGNLIGDYYTAGVQTTNEWQIMMNNSSAFLNVYRHGTGYVINNTSSGFSANTWINVVLTRIGSAITLYANNNIIGTATNSSVFGSATGNVNIGIDGNNVAEPFSGLISNVLIYQKGLSAAEVARNYETQKSRFANTIVQQGLVLNLDAGNPYSYAGSGTTWYDASGTGNNGTLTNGPVYNSINGGVITLDGIDDYITCANSASLQITSALTLETWFYNTAAVDGLGMIVKGPLSSDYDYMLYLSGTSTIVYFYKKDSGGNAYYGGVVTSSLINRWLHVIVTHTSGGLYTMYINGAIVDSTTFASSSIRSSSNPLFIGAGWNPDYFYGNIGQTRIYNIALSAAQVLQNYNATKGRYGL